MLGSTDTLESLGCPNSDARQASGRQYDAFVAALDALIMTRYSLIA